MEKELAVSGFTCYSKTGHSERARNATRNTESAKRPGKRGEREELSKLGKEGIWRDEYVGDAMNRAENPRK